MEYVEYKTGRVFIVRFDEGDSEVIKDIENFARSHKISSGVITILGALKKPEVVVGSKNVNGKNRPYWARVNSEEGYEVVGFGTIFPIVEKIKNRNIMRPSIHLHIAAGKRNVKSIVGCLRGMKDVYITLECIIQEILPVKRGLSFVRRRRSDGVALIDIFKSKA